MVYGIVKNSNGYIHVESQEAKAASLIFFSQW